MWSISASNSEGIGFMAVIVFMALLSVLAFGLRVYSHRQNRAALDASDYTCLCGMVSEEKSWISRESLPRILKVVNIGLVVVLWGGKSTNLSLPSLLMLPADHLEAFSHGWGEDISKFDLADARFASVVCSLNRLMLKLPRQF